MQGHKLRYEVFMDYLRTQFNYDVIYDADSSFIIVKRKNKKLDFKVDFEVCRKYGFCPWFLTTENGKDTLSFRYCNC